MEYPKMMYHESGQTSVVPTQDAASKLGPGWSEKPSDVHRAAPGTTEGGHVPPSGQSDFAMLVASHVIEMMAERYDVTPKGTAAQAAAPLDLKAPAEAQKPAKKDQANG